MKTILFFFTACFFVPFSVNAEESDSFTTVLPTVRVTKDDVVETPTGRGEPSRDTPYRVDKISHQRLHDKNLTRSAPEALKEVPGVLMQKTAQGQGSPFIRGFTAFRTVNLIDGIRLNNSAWRDGPNQYLATVDPAIVHSLEVVKGPSSTLHGSDSIGGTVNFLTRPLKEAETAARASYQYGTADLRSISRGEYQGVAGDTKYLVGGSYRSFGDLVAGDEMGHQPYTGYDEYAGDIKARHELSGSNALVLAVQKHQQIGVPRTHKTEFAKSFEGTSVGSEKRRELDQGRELVYLRWLKGQSGPIRDTQVTLHWHHHTEEQFRIKSDDTQDKQGFDLVALGLSASGIADSSFGQWNLGLEVIQESATSFKDSFDANGNFTGASIQGPMGDDADYNSMAIYAQNTYHINDRWATVVGARHSLFAVDVGTYEDPTSGLPASLEKDYSNTSGNLRAIYKIDEEHRLYGGVSQGFRAPNLSDLTRFDTARSNEIETPSPNLDPESYLSYELGFRCTHDNHTFETAVFYTEVNDMIIRQPTGNTISGDSEVTKANAGEGFVKGIEVSASSQWGRWQGDFMISWMDGEIDTYPTSANVLVREPMSRIMPLTAHLRGRYSIDDRSWAEVTVTHANRQDRLSTRDKNDSQRIPPDGTPGYTIFSLRGGYDLSEYLSTTIAIENIADKNYRVHGSGSNEAGRNIIVGIRATL